MRRRAVAIIGDRDPDTFRGWLIRDMVAASHGVAVCQTPVDKLVSTITGLGAGYRPVSLDQTGLDPVRAVHEVIALSRILRAKAADVVLTHSTGRDVGPFAAGLWGSDVIAMIGGFGRAFTEGRELRRKALRVTVAALLGLSLCSCSGVFVLNDADEDFVRSQRRVRPARRVVKINSTGIDLEQFSYSPASLDCQANFAAYGNIS
jgi:hypothetical protein